MFVAQLFFIYLDVTQVVQGTQSDTFAEEVIFDLLSFSFYMMEIVSIVWLSTNIEREGVTIGLNMYEVCVDIDERLKESVSVDIFSEQSVCKTLNMLSICIDCSVLHSRAH